MLVVASTHCTASSSAPKAFVVAVHAPYASASEREIPRPHRAHADRAAAVHGLADIGDAGGHVTLLGQGPAARKQAPQRRAREANARPTAPAPRQRVPCAAGGSRRSCESWAENNRANTDGVRMAELRARARPCASWPARLRRVAQHPVRQRIEVPRDGARILAVGGDTRPVLVRARRSSRHWRLWSRTSTNVALPPRGVSEQPVPDRRDERIVLRLRPIREIPQPTPGPRACARARSARKPGRTAPGTIRAVLPTCRASSRARV